MEATGRAGGQLKEMGAAGRAGGQMKDLECNGGLEHGHGSYWKGWRSGKRDGACWKGWRSDEGPGMERRAGAWTWKLLEGLEVR